MTANVYLNGEEKGYFSITLTDEGKMLFARKEIVRLGIKDIPADATGVDGYVSLSPRVRAVFDEDALIVHLTAETERLEETQAGLITTTTSATPSKLIHSHVYLNGEDKGYFFITLTDTGKILIAREDLMRLGIKDIPEDSPGEDGYVSLSPRLRAEFDKPASILSLTVVQDLLDPTLSVPAPLPFITAAPVVKPSLPDAPAQNAEHVVINVQVNHVDKGDFFVKRTDNDSILVTRNDLLRMGITEIPEGGTAGVDGTLEIGSLAPLVHSEFDEKTSTLHVTVEPELLEKTTIDLARKPPSVTIPANETSAFVNYGLSYTADDELEFASLAVPLEAGITTNGYLSISTFSYTRDTNDDRFVRLMTSIVKDDPPNRTRTIAGDFSTSSGMLGSGGIFGGLSIAKKFSIDPYSLRYPGANLYGSVNTPSDVEVYVNGLLVGKEHLSPGEFEFQNIGNLQGSGEATLVIKDAYGREQTINVPYYTSAQLLLPGLHDYSYSVGYHRESFGQKSNEYGDAAFLGYHRVGITDALTAGLRAEGDADVVNGGATTTFLLGTLGEFDLSAAASRDNAASGHGWSARYSRAGRYVSWGLFGRGLSRDYSNLAITSSDDKPRLEASGNLGFRQDWMGSVSFFYSKKDMYVDIDRKRYGVSYNRRLAPQVSLNVVAARTIAETTTNELFANLMIVLGKARSATLAYQRQGDETAVRASLQQNAPLGTGFGYRLSADQRNNGEDDPANGGDAYLQYRGNHGIYSAEHRIIDGTRSSMVGTAGGIAFINRSVYFTRPIYDGFVLAKVGEFENVAVNYNHQPVGVTDNHGELLIPELVSYHTNDISINDKAIPVNYELSAINRSISLPYRAGGVVRFDAKKLQGFSGRMKISDRGLKTDAEYWGLQITQENDVHEVIIGKNGEFYLENLPAGRIPARIFSNNTSCSFELSIPDSEAAMVNLGEVICEKH